MMNCKCVMVYKGRIVLPTILSRVRNENGELNAFGLQKTRSMCLHMNDIDAQVNVHRH